VVFEVAPDAAGILRPAMTIFDGRRDRHSSVVEHFALPEPWNGRRVCLDLHLDRRSPDVSVLAAIGILLLVLGILTGGILALVALGRIGSIIGVRRLDSDIHAWDGQAVRSAGE
jgi:hypothetical protein